MKVAVWDTYVSKKDGNILHFDIVVKEELKDAAVVFGYGKKYLASKNEEGQPLSAAQCQFCHIEEPTEEMKTNIYNNGFHILEMEEIPSQLKENASRRDMILYLRGHYDKYRFFNFHGKPDAEIREIISLLKNEII
jgi:hypothetical protein